MDPAFRSPSSTELLLAAKPRARRCQRAPSYHIGNAEYEKHIIERGGSFDQNKDRHFTLVSPSDRNPNKKHNGLQPLQDSPRRDLRCAYGRRAEEEPQVLPNAQWLSCLCRHEPQGVRQETSTIRNSSRSEEGRKICSFRIPRGLLPSRTHRACETSSNMQRDSRALGGERNTTDERRARSFSFAHGSNKIAG